MAKSPPKAGLVLWAVCLLWLGELQLVPGEASIRTVLKPNWPQTSIVAEARFVLCCLERVRFTYFEQASSLRARARICFGDLLNSGILSRIRCVTKRTRTSMIRSSVYRRICSRKRDCDSLSQPWPLASILPQCKFLLSSTRKIRYWLSATASCCSA